jgi:hypothetical protein
MTLDTDDRRAGHHRLHAVRRPPARDGRGSRRRQSQLPDCRAPGNHPPGTALPRVLSRPAGERRPVALPFGTRRGPHSPAVKCAMERALRRSPGRSRPFLSPDAPRRAHLMGKPTSHRHSAHQGGHLTGTAPGLSMTGSMTGSSTGSSFWPMSQGRCQLVPIARGADRAGSRAPIRRTSCQPRHAPEGGRYSWKATHSTVYDCEEMAERMSAEAAEGNHQFSHFGPEASGNCNIKAWMRLDERAGVDVASIRFGPWPTRRRRACGRPW